MVVKIIRRGNLPSNKSIVTTCRICLTQFSFAQSDAKRVHDPRDGDYYQLNCPACNETVTVASSLFNQPNPQKGRIIRKPLKDG